MSGDINKILDGRVFAVVGSFSKKTKFAYRIVSDLLKTGKTVYPVNKRGGYIKGLKCYKSILDIPVQIDTVSIVTPPEVTEKIVRECSEKEINNVWMQPGAESQNAIDYCIENGINAVYRTCLLMRL
jgi:predicted CoA-binding protein